MSSEQAEDTGSKNGDEPQPQKILVIDIGGTKLKALVTGETEPRKIASGKRLTPSRMINEVEKLAEGWEYEAVSIGFPGLVGDHGPLSEPLNLGSGWVGFDYAAAFKLPVRMCNDASMQALGSYEGGRMLFLGFGTGLGSALIIRDTIISLELGRLLFIDGRELGELLGRRGLRTTGRKQWRATIERIVPALMAAFSADYVVLGGGNSKEIKSLPAGARLGHNLTAFRGGFRLWQLEESPLRKPSDEVVPGVSVSEWRLH